MTPKEKAQELVDRFSEYSHTDFDYNKRGYQVKSQIANAKQCALIAVDEIIKSNPRLPHTLDWQQVKTEIENL